MAAEGLCSAFHKGNVFKGCLCLKGSLQWTVQKVREYDDLKGTFIEDCAFSLPCPPIKPSRGGGGEGGGDTVQRDTLSLFFPVPPN